MNREKVIKGLEQIVNDPFMKARADYWVLVCSDAIALLKEMQEQIDKLLEENASNAEIAEGLKELLKEQEAVVKQWIKEIADNQLAHAPKDSHEFMTLDEHLENEYKRGIWDGLQIAWNIISEGR